MNTSTVNTFEFTTLFGSKKNGYLTKANYCNNNNLCFEVMCKDEDEEYFEPWSRLTVNIIDLPDDLVAIDMNNKFDNIYEILCEAGALIPTGKTLTSGFCEYPVCKVTDKINQWIKEGEE